ncbi:MAG TPA: hypothetical protein VI757_06740, partial [Bacteroidia bacterium]|nr:hypothetical protein [Bacteroidia bacterium]
SPDESMLALANFKQQSNFNINNSDVTVIHLLPNGDLNTSLGVNGLTRITIDNTKQYTGIEFSPDNLKLFVGAKNVGIHWIDIPNNFTPMGIISSLTAPYGNSQLETAFDVNGNYLIYAASSSTDLSAIDPFPAIPTFTSNAITSINPFVVDPAASPYVQQQLQNFLLLPDQIDGEVYQDFAPDLPTEPNSCCLFNSDFTVIQPFTAAVIRQREQELKKSQRMERQKIASKHNPF